MDDLRMLADKQGIVEVLTDLFVATDRRDWAAVEACLADEVLFDTSSLGDPPAARTAARDLAASWEKGLAPLAAIHHQAGNFRVWPRGDTTRRRVLVTSVPAGDQRSPAWVPWKPSRRSC